MFSQKKLEIIFIKTLFDYKLSMSKYLLETRFYKIVVRVKSYFKIGDIVTGFTVFCPKLVDSKIILFRKLLDKFCFKNIMKYRH